MEQSITWASFLLCISLASAQLTFRLDANSNSYTLKTPNSQQTFTQHFNAGRQGAAARQGSFHQVNAAAYQPQQQQLQSTGPHQFAEEQSNNRQDASNDYYRQQLELQQQLQQQQQQLQQQQLQRQAEQSNLYTTYQQPQQYEQQQYQQREAGQQQAYSAQDLSPYYQQIQQAQQAQLLQQQQQQQRQHLAAQPQFAYQHSQAAAVSADNGQDGSSFAQYDPQSQKYQSQQQAAANRLLGSAFSPSNEVSHVKFSNSVANYDF